jgi:hypothetical protein
MVDSALTILLVSSFVFVALSVMANKERRQGRRFFGVALREKLDTLVDEAGNGLVKSWEHFSKYIVQLSWYYSLHSVLKGMLKLIVKFYTYFENLFERNRTRTKQLRAEKMQLSEYSHLQQMTDHRKETSLTPSEQKKLKKKHLDGKV